MTSRQASGLEIDAMNGAIVRLAHQKGISVPVNETITLLIKAKEALAGRMGGMS